MQQTLNAGWAQSARLNGVFRYHWKVLGKTVAWVLLILLASQILSLLMPLVFDIHFTYTGVYADLSITLIAALVCAIVAAQKSTRFLLRFGTSRLSVWMGNLLALFAGMTAVLIGTMLISILAGGVTLALANAMPRKYVFVQFFVELKGSALFSQSLTDAVRTLPSYILYTVEWCCLFYLLGCCLRRNRALTLTILIGVPMLLTILMLFPAVRQAAEVVRKADENQMLILGVQWTKVLVDIAHFVQNEWQTIQLGAAVVSLPLSYLCMRNTPQP